jgi:hypothetical protein
VLTKGHLRNDFATISSFLRLSGREMRAWYRDEKSCLWGRILSTVSPIFNEPSRSRFGPKHRTDDVKISLEMNLISHSGDRPALYRLFYNVTNPKIEGSRDDEYLHR